MDRFRPLNNRYPILRPVPPEAISGQSASRAAAKTLCSALATLGKPSWSPHGYRIAYSEPAKERGHRLEDIWTMPAERGRLAMTGQPVTPDIYENPGVAP
jgi:hypothetical protein